jgi:hypothetical protein
LDAGIVVATTAGRPATWWVWTNAVEVLVTWSPPGQPDPSEPDTVTGWPAAPEDGLSVSVAAACRARPAGGGTCAWLPPLLSYAGQATRGLVAVPGQRSISLAGHGMVPAGSRRAGGTASNASRLTTRC